MCGWVAGGEAGAPGGRLSAKLVGGDMGHMWGHSSPPRLSGNPGALVSGVSHLHGLTLDSGFQYLNPNCPGQSWQVIAEGLVPLLVHAHSSCGNLRQKLPQKAFRRQQS